MRFDFFSGIRSVPHVSCPVMSAFLDPCAYGCHQHVENGYDSDQFPPAVTEYREYSYH